MDGTLSKLVSFLKADDTRLACAAAVLLAELAPREASVVKSLRQALDKSDAARRPFLIEALGRIGTADAAEALTPWIKKGGPSGEEALRAVAHAGKGALKPLFALLKDAAPYLRTKLAEAIARTGEPSGFQALLAQMRTGDEDTVRSMREGLRRACNGMSADSRAVMRKQIDKALEAPTFIKNAPAHLAAVELLGDTRDAGALPSLERHVGKKFSAQIHGAALMSIKQLDLTPQRRGKLATKLLPLLSDADASHHIGPALEALRGGAIGKEHRSTLQKLANATRHEVREFAMEQLAGMGTTRNLSDLIDRLEDLDRSVREDAAHALEGAPGVAGPLAERLLKTSNGEACRLMARILQRMIDQVPAKTAPHLAKAYADAATGQMLKKAGTLDEDQRAQLDARRAALFTVCRALPGEDLAQVCLKHASKLRSGGDSAKAYALLKSISGVMGWSDEHRIEQALAGVATRPLDLSRAARQNDSNLRLLEQALDGGTTKPTPLGKSVGKDKVLSRAAQYYLGHHFAESFGGARAFGKAVLESLAANPRNEEGKRAKEKLVLEGLAAKAGRAKAGLLEERAKVLMAATDLKVESEKDSIRRTAKKERAAKRKAERDQAKQEAEMKETLKDRRKNARASAKSSKKKPAKKKVVKKTTKKKAATKKKKATKKKR